MSQKWQRHGGMAPVRWEGSTTPQLLHVLFIGRSWSPFPAIHQWEKTEQHWMWKPEPRAYKLNIGIGHALQRVISPSRVIQPVSAAQHSVKDLFQFSNQTPSKEIFVNWETLDIYSIFFGHKAFPLHKIAPSCHSIHNMSSYFPLIRTNLETRRTCSTADFHGPRPRLSMLQRFHLYSVPKLWNTTPLQLRRELAAAST